MHLRLIESLPDFPGQPCAPRERATTPFKSKLLSRTEPRERGGISPTGPRGSRRKDRLRAGWVGSVEAVEAHCAARHHRMLNLGGRARQAILDHLRGAGEEAVAVRVVGRPQDLVPADILASTLRLPSTGSNEIQKLRRNKSLGRVFRRESLDVPVASVFYFEQQGAALINAKSSSRPNLQPDPQPVTYQFCRSTTVATPVRTSNTGCRTGKRRPASHGRCVVFQIAGGSFATRMAMPWRWASTSLKPTRASGGSVNMP
jgi:hypothetical protein